MKDLPLPENLRIKQNSCANCLYCRRGQYMLDWEKWECVAPQNLYANIFNIVTGERVQLNRYCKDIRNQKTLHDICTMQKPSRIYYPNGNSKTHYQIEREASMVLSSRHLKNLTEEDL